MRRFGFLLFWYTLVHNSFAQVNEAQITYWARQFSQYKDFYEPAPNQAQLALMVNAGWNPDTATHYLNLVLRSPKARPDNPVFKFRVMQIRTAILHSDPEKRSRSKEQPFLDSLLQLAYQTGDKRLVAYAYWTYGTYSYDYQDLETAAAYCLRAVQTFDEYPPFPALYSNYCVLGEILFHSREYRSSVDYTLKGVYQLLDEKVVPARFIARYYNTAGQAYQRLGMPDSSLYFFNISSQLAQQHGDALWVSINALSTGDIRMAQPEWRKAKILFEEAYNANRSTDPAIEAAALLGMGRWQLKNNNRDSALIYLSQSLARAASQTNDSNRLRMASYRLQAYDAMLQLHIQQGQPDSIFYYQSLYRCLNDSLTALALRSSLKFVALRNRAENDEKTVQELRTNIARERMRRNLILAAIVLVATTAIFFLNRQRKLLQLKQKADRLEQEASQQALAHARQQLSDFTQRLQEKTDLLDKMVRQSDAAYAPVAYHESVAELARQTILTEEDWQRFKTLFNTIEPQFFPELRRRFPNITEAEQRMAALIFLQIDNKAMAAMLGISADSVRKTKQRLRQRLQITADTDVFSLLKDL